MVRESLIQAWVGLLLVGSTSCLGVDLVDPEGDQPPRASVTLQTEERDSTTISLRVSLNAGTDHAGRPRILPSPTIRMGGQVVPSLAENESGVYEFQYDSTYSLSNSPAALLIELPMVNSVAPTLTVPIRRRQGEFKISLTAGVDLELATSSEPFPANARARWRASVASACTQPITLILSIDGIGSPPPIVTIPNTLLGSALPQHLEVCLQYIATWTHELSGYLVGTTVEEVSVWQFARQTTTAH